MLTALVVEHECDHHVDLVFHDLRVVTAHVLLFDPGAPDIAERFDARAMPCWIASSKLFDDVALISDTLATDIPPSFD